MSEFITERRKNKNHSCKYCGSPLVCAEERDGGLFICCLVCKMDFPALREDDSKIMTFNEMRQEFNG